MSISLKNHEDRITALENKVVSLQTQLLNQQSTQILTKWSGNLLNKTRRANTIYTNTTGYAILISYETSNGPRNGPIKWYVDGVIIGASNGYGDGGGGMLMVPAGKSYKLIQDRSTVTSWFETIK